MRLNLALSSILLRSSSLSKPVDSKAVAGRSSHNKNDSPNLWLAKRSDGAKYGKKKKLFHRNNVGGGLNSDDEIESGGGGVLVNNKKKKKKHPPVSQECQPGEDAPPDVGILSCGMGYYCLESDESAMGGFCVPQQQDNQDPLQLSSDLMSASNQRRLQNLGNGICPDPNEPDDGYNCDCSGFDETGAGLVTDCVIYGEQELCYDLEPNQRGATEICMGITLDAVYTADIGLEETTFCYAFTTNANPPYAGSYCVGETYDVNGTTTACDLSINEEPCRTCNIITCDTGEPLFEFDCTNTAAGTMGSGCNDDDALPIFGYLVDEETDPPSPVDTGMPTMMPSMDMEPPSGIPVTGIPTKMPSMETDSPSMAPVTKVPSTVTMQPSEPTASPVAEAPTMVPNSQPPEPPTLAPTEASAGVAANSQRSVLWSCAVSASVLVWMMHLTR